jgi:hypothetical protein
VCHWKSCSHLCAIDLNFFTLYAISSIFASNSVKWTGKMTILPLQPSTANSPFFYLYATQFSKITTTPYFYLYAIHFSKSQQRTYCYLNEWQNNQHFLFRKKQKNTSLVFKLILDKTTNITNTSLCFKSIHHIIINIRDTHLFQIHHIISNNIISNKFWSWHLVANGFHYIT